MMTDRQLVVATVLGVVLWFAAASFVRLAPELFDGARSSAILFGVVIITSALTVAIAEWLGRANGAVLVTMMAWGTGVALILDGLGVSFVSYLYADVSPASQHGLALIAWGAGLGLLFAVMRATMLARTVQP